MPYVEGDKLDRMIEATGLGELAVLLRKIGAGEAAWPGQPFVVNIEHPQREQFRNLLYALLRSLGLKDSFSVKAVGNDELHLNLKKTSLKAHVMGFREIQQFALQPQAEMLGDEGLGEILAAEDD